MPCHQMGQSLLRCSCLLMILYVIDHQVGQIGISVRRLHPRHRVDEVARPRGIIIRAQLAQGSRIQLGHSRVASDSDNKH